MLKLNEYIHITSPIRRLVDLLNMTELQHYIGIMPFNEKSKKFHNFWTCSEKLSYINQTMQSIRKVQNEFFTTTATASICCRRKPIS